MPPPLGVWRGALRKKALREQLPVEGAVFAAYALFVAPLNDPAHHRSCGLAANVREGPRTESADELQKRRGGAHGAPPPERDRCEGQH